MGIDAGAGAILGVAVRHLPRRPWCHSADRSCDGLAVVTQLLEASLGARPG
jgi:hypothetical protein